MNLDKCVLFSPIGTSDPIRGGFDGSMLHITRYYKPEKVYLYYSEDMYERDLVDNKCELAIKILNPKIQVIKFKGKALPYDFDSFIVEFNRIINTISEENPDSEIILNVSSGTPQMKSTLCLEAVTTNKKIRVVQVTTPIEGPNTDRPELSKNRDIAELMENNLDNLDEANNRCMEPGIMSFKYSMLKSQVKSLIDIYDYEGAAKLISEFENESLQRLIIHCKHRLNLDYIEAKKEIDKYNGLNLFPVAESSISRIVEYYLMLKIKQRRKQLTDMIIGLNPLIIELMEDYLKIVWSIDTSQFYDKYTNGETVVNLSKLEMKDPDFRRYLDSAFKYGFRDKSTVGIDFLDEAIVFYSKGSRPNEVEFFGKLRNANRMLRNPSAHSLIAISEKDIQKNSNMTSNQIINRLEGLIKSMYGNKVEARVFDIYDEMNYYITEELNKY